MEKFFDCNGKLKNGTTFEMFIAEQLGGEHDGAPGQPDVVLEDGRKVECKFFTRKINVKTGKHIYNYANGFLVQRKDALLRDLLAYCKGFDLLAVGRGDFGDSDTCEYQLLTREEAFEWLAARILAKGKEAIRFAFEAETVKPGSIDQRLRRLQENGFAL